MGLKITSMTTDVKRNITLQNLFNKTIAIDGFNVLYQVLYSIRDRRNKPLMNRKGEITSHLIGLFFKNVKFLEKNITPIYCFDGLDKTYKIKRSKNDIKVDAKILDSTKKLLDLMSINWIQAPSEGEAQCVELLKKGDAWAVASQDYDVLLYGGDRFIRNLTLTSKEIEYISLNKFLEINNITQEQLIDFSILIGNDYFPGIKGIGEKTAIKELKKYKSIENMEFDLQIELKNKEIIKKEEFFDKFNTLRTYYTNPNVDKDYKINKRLPKIEELTSFLIEDNDFDPKRTNSTINKLKDRFFQKRQVSMTSFFNKDSQTTENNMKSDDKEPEIKQERRMF